MTPVFAAMVWSAGFVLLARGMWRVVRIADLYLRPTLCSVALVAVTLAGMLAGAGLCLRGAVRTFGGW